MDKRRIKRDRLRQEKETVTQKLYCKSIETQQCGRLQARQNRLAVVEHIDINMSNVNP